ncbi:MAG TPA: PLxRFG domain-containing protein [Pseudomonas sp.]
MAFDPTTAVPEDELALYADEKPAEKQAAGGLPKRKPFNPATAQETPEAVQGVGGTLWQGLKSASRAIGATVDTYTGDEQGTVEKAQTQQEAPKDYRLQGFYDDVQRNTEATKASLPEGEDVGVLDAIGNVGKAVIDNPGGAGLAMVEQLPNSAPALAGGWAGMKAGAAGGAALGSVVPGVGTAIGGAVGGVVGGLAGMFLGNAAIETGHKAMEAAGDGSYTSEEQSQVAREGAVKGGVITAVDAVTLGLGGAVSGAMQRTTRSALESATRKALMDKGVDLADEAAVLAARQSPEISAAVRAAQESAVKATDTLKRRAAEAGTLLGMESVGEGVGEYLGELAASGEANVTDAVMESLLSMGQSTVEAGWNMSRQRKDQGLWSAAEDLVQPEPTPENPAPAPVPRPNPFAGPLSSAASRLPKPILDTNTIQRETGMEPLPVLDTKALERQLGPLSTAADTASPAAPSEQQPAAPGDRPYVGQPVPLRGGGNAAVSAVDDTAGTVTVTGAGGSWTLPVADFQQRVGKAGEVGKAEAPNPLTQPAQPATQPSAGGLPSARRAQPAATEQDLRSQLDYLEGQARSSGGWTPALSKERARVNGELAKIATPPQQSAPNIAAEAPNTAPAAPVVADGAQAAAPSLEGENIDGDWARFTPESGTLSVPRAKMPQIKAEHRGAMVNFLNARGIQHEEQSVPATSLKPTQGEFSRQKVEQAKGFTGGDRAILVSADNHVLDGHHQWLARRDSGDDVRVIRLKAPIADLLPAVAEFPSSTVDESSQMAVKDAAPAAPESAPAVAPAGQTTEEPTAEQGQAATTATQKPVKWFGARKKAEDYLRKNNLRDTHEIRIKGKNYEIHPKAEAQAGEQPASASSKPTVEAVKAAKEARKMQRPEMERREVESSAGVGKIVASQTRDREGEYGVSWASTDIATAGSMEEAAAIAKAVAESGADNIAAMREVAKQVSKPAEQKPANLKEGIEAARKKKAAESNKKGTEKTPEKSAAAESTAPEAAADSPSAENLIRADELERQANAAYSIYHRIWHGGDVGVLRSDLSPAERLEAERANVEWARLNLEANRLRRTVGRHQEANYRKHRENLDRLEALSAAPTEPEQTKVPEPNGAEFGELFHGTARPFESFDSARLGKNGGGYAHQGIGAYLTDDRDGYARFFADKAAVKVSQADKSLSPEASDELFHSGGAVIPVKLSGDARMLDLRNPGADAQVRELFERSVGDKSVGAQLRQRVLELGYDGLVFTEPNAIEGWNLKPDAITAVVYNEAKAQVVKPVAAASAAPAEKKPAKAKQPTALDNAASSLSDAKLKAAMKLKALLDSRKGTLNSGVDPELMIAVANVGALTIAEGAVKFAVWVRDVIATTRAVGIADEDVKPFLKEAYGAIASNPEKYGVTDEQADDMNTPREIRGTDIDAIVAEMDDTSDTNDQGASDERNAVQGEGTEALDPVAAGQGEGAQGGGRAGVDPAGSGGERAGETAGADGAGVSGARSGGGSAAGADPAETGTGDRVTKAKRKKKVAGTEDRPEVAGEPTSAPNIPAADFQITDELGLGQGGEVAKFNDNLAAIRTLKTIEDESRRATPDEQALLARYVGWGGLASAFPDPLSGAFKPAWEKRGKELRELLTPDEYAAARRSTRNAHYTSKPVVEAMWKAVERLGFRGGLALESSMGVGNFLGLKPTNLPANFIGVEYDGLTARLAKALYPQATVLHSGFQDVPLPDNAFALSIGNPPFGSEALRFQYKPELAGVSIHNQFFRASMDALRPGGLQAMVVSRYLMDAQDKSTRLALAGQARLVAAIRLPDTAFKENARTDVVTDIIILQKLTEAEQSMMEDAINASRQAPAKNTEDERARREKAAKVPAWVETTKMPDPLGGEAMTVNAYFKDNPQNILGVLERSGSMQHGADITVRLDNPSDLSRLLEEAVGRLPEGIHNLDAEVLAATEQRHKAMSDGLRIALAGQEVGHVQLNRDGKVERTIERETPEGGIELGLQVIDENSPWSDQLAVDDKGRWYRTVVVTDEQGKSVKIKKEDGTDTNRNLTTREVFATEADVPKSLRLGATGFARLQAVVKLRDLLKRQLVLETSDAPDAMMNGNRRTLASAYEEFVKKFGPVNRSANLSTIMTMPDGGLVAALEVVYKPAVSADKAAKSGMQASEEVVEPAPILRERVVPKYEPATSAGSAADALVISLSETGRVNMERIAQLRGLSVEEAAAELQAGDKPLVFLDPETKTWETADAYLSGQVRRKLNAAKLAMMPLNIAALEAVQPEPWTAENVTVMLGSTWVPEKVYSDFLTHLTGGNASVRFAYGTNTFTVSAEKDSSEWSTDAVTTEYLVSRLLNSQPVVVRYTDSKGVSHIAQESTQLAQLKAKEIAAEFMDWVFKDGDRRAVLVEVFNEKFNTRVVRQRDGSHMQLPGKVPDSIIAMRRHQLNAIWRGIAERFMLVDHAVGAGKTFTAIARAMERRRMGLSRKPMIVVPNHLIEQWAADIYRLYPGAKVLAAGKKDFEAKRRRRLFGKIATGDWDIVLVPHSSFGFIGIDPSTEKRFLAQEMEQALEAVKDAQEQAAEDGTDNGFRKPFGVKEAERLVEKIQARMDRLNAGTKDRLLTFEQMGVDDLTVDEAHEFKNLYYSSRLTGVRGMGDKTGSRKANDLYNKIRALTENPNSSVTFLTGTPISNSAVEMFTMMRYLAPDQLKDMGLEHFDAWRAQFVEATAAFEPTESGRLKEVTRLGRSWSNMRSLMDLYYEFTDAVSLEDIQQWYSEDNDGARFPVPEVKGGDRQLVAIQPTKAQEAMLLQITAGFDGLDGIDDPHERNAERLRLMDRARKLSLDVRAVDPRNRSDEKGGKLDRAAQEIKRLHDQWSHVNGAQMVFLDRSVPSAKGDDKLVKEYDELVAKRDEALRTDDDEAYDEAQEKLDLYDANEIAELREALKGGWNAYQQLKDSLIASGIPAHEIRFVQEANNDEQKKALFEAVNEGKVRVLIGSTPRMGAGTNAQKRLVGLHHIDVTWKPSDIEQREGRIIRQGNLFATPSTDDKPNPHFIEGFEVEILAYATERTVDAKMWDLNATKLRTINGIRKYSGAFSMEFEDADSVSMAEMAALASGNPLLLERVKTESEISQLELQERAFRRRMYGVQDGLASAERALRDLPAGIEQAAENEDTLRAEAMAIDERHAARAVIVEGKTYNSAKEAHAAAQAAVGIQQAGNPKARYSLTIDGARITSKEGIETAISGAMGDSSPFEAVIDGKPVFQRVAVARAVAERMNAIRAGMTVGESRTETIGKMLGMDLVLDLSAYEQEGEVYVDHSLSLVDAKGRTVDSRQLPTGRVDGTATANSSRTTLGELYQDGRQRSTGDGSARMRRTLERARKDLPELQAKASETFPKTEELAAKRKRLGELVRLLSADGAAAPVQEEAAAPVIESSRNPDGSYTRMDPVADVDYRMAAGPVKKGIPLFTAKQIAARLNKQGFKIEVVASEVDLPTDVFMRMHRAGVIGGVEGLYQRATGKSYLIANNLRSPQRAIEVALHEIVGHGGIKALLGDQLTPVMRRIFNDMPTAERDRLMRKYAGVARGRTIDQAEQLVAEEYVAHLAETDPRNSLVNQLVAMIRAWIRKVFGDKVALQWTHADMVNLLAEARKVVLRGPNNDSPRGGVRAPASAQLAFSVGGRQEAASPAPFDWSSGTASVARYPEMQITWPTDDFADDGTPYSMSVSLADSPLRGFIALEGMSSGEFAITESGIRDENDRGNGLGGRMYRAAIEFLTERGLAMLSDVTLSPDSQRMYESLRSRGYTVEVLNEPGINEDGWAVAEGPIYRVTKDTDDVRYSLAGAVLDRLPPMPKLDRKSLTRKGSGLLSDLKPGMLGALPLMYLREFAPRSMTALAKYIEEKRQMDADRNELHTKYDKVAQKWLKLNWKNRGAGKAMADLMHASTIAGVDPSVPFKSIMTAEDNQRLTFSPASTAYQAAATKKARDDERRAAYSPLKAQYDALPAEHRAMFGEARDSYSNQVKLMEQVVEDNIRKSAEYTKKKAARDRDRAIEEARDELTGAELAEAIADADKRYASRAKAAEEGTSAKLLLLRKKFEGMRVEEPYFPLKRFGDYFVAMRDGKKLVSFSMFESAAKMEEAAEELRKTYPGLEVKVGRQSQKQDLQGAVDPGFVVEVQELVARLPGSEEIADGIYQLYLDTLPDLSMRKGFIHRKKTPGFDRDALRAFSSSMFHSSYQIARLKHSLEMNELLEQVTDQAKEATDPVDAMTIANEVRKRHDWVMAPKGGALAQRITSAAFVYMLGATPAAAFVNTTQTFMMGIPTLGARFKSEKNATRELMRASGDFLKGRGHLDKVLTGDEAKAFAEFLRLGLIDKTQAHDLAGVGETGVEYSPVRHKVMGYISWMFHSAERYNREVTAMAAYRMARAAGMDQAAAINEAAELTWTIHFDYSSGNRARYMQSDTAKVLLVFRQFQVNMLSRLVSDMRTAMKGETPEVKAEAKRRLAGIFGMFALFAGAMGIPGMSALLLLLNGLDDDDDPWTAEDKIRRAVTEALGADLAAVFFHGVPGTLTGVSLTERIGMGSLWFRDPNRELEGKDAYLYWMEQVLGAAPAMVANAFVGASMAGEGQVMRGIEAASPKAIRDLLKAGRYAGEGAQTMSGDMLVDDVGGWGILAQALGFTPAHLTEQYEHNNALKTAEQKILTERRSLMNRHALAARTGDDDMRLETRGRIDEFNRRYPKVAITGKTLALSMRARAQRDQRTDGGLTLDTRLEWLRDEL